MDDYIHKLNDANFAIKEKELEALKKEKHLKFEIRRKTEHSLQ